MAVDALLVGRGLEYRYPGGAPGTEMALSGADIELHRGERVAVLGASGSGKTTLLYCLAGITVPNRGEVYFQGRHLHALSADERAAIRLANFGFVFQFAQLVPELSLLENVTLPLRLTGRWGRAAGDRAADLLARLGIEAVAGRRPHEVSGGQAQRCAVARALVHQPQVVFADEPTGALDAVSGRATLDELLALTDAFGTALLVVTHDPGVARRLDRAVHVTDGRCSVGAR